MAISAVDQGLAERSGAKFPSFVQAARRDLRTSSLRGADDGPAGEATGEDLEPRDRLCHRS